MYLKTQLFIFLVCGALLGACTSPKALYEGPLLPENKVVLLKGLTFRNYQAGQKGKGNSVVGNGKVVLIGIDGNIFNKKVSSVYSGDDFHLLPGRHSLLAYCEYVDTNTGKNAPLGKTYYSDFFTISFTAKEGKEYRYQADFHFDTLDKKGRLTRNSTIVAKPGIWDVTAGSSNRVNEKINPVPLNNSTHPPLQAEIDK